MPQPYTVICADRNTGEEYPLVFTADSPQGALQKAAKAGHITSRIGNAPANPGAPAEHHPTETDELLRTLIREARGARTDLATMVPLVADCAAFSRRQKHITISIAAGVVIGLCLWTGLAWLLAGVILAQYAATHPR